jgi:hypothetical protein
MLAYVGAVRLAAGERDGLELAPATAPVTPTSLLRVTRKGRGMRWGAKYAWFQRNARGEPERLPAIDFSQIPIGFSQIRSSLARTERK